MRDADAAAAAEDPKAIGAVRADDGTLPLRLGMGAVVGIEVGLLAGWTVAAFVGALLVLSQLASHAHGRAILRAEPGSGERTRRVAILPRLNAITSLCYTAACPALWFSGAQAGPLLAALLAIGSAQYCWLHYSAVPRMAYATAAANLSWLAVLPTLSALGALRAGTGADALAWLAVALGAVFFAVNLVQSIRDNAAIARRLAEARTQAEAAARAKTDFLANMSHEIRTPMNGVLGMAEMLERSGLDPQQAEMTRIIRSSGGALLTVINDVLDFSKIEAGKVALHPAPTDLRAVIGDVASLLGVTAAERDLGLGVRIARETPPLLLADAGRLRQVVTNLLGNAVKFTEAGEVAVEVDCTLDGDEGVAALVLRVRDTGPGIAEGLLPRLFGSFEQDEASGAARQGTGLGLAITRALVEAMDGTIEAANRPEGGACFTVRLSLPVAAPAGETAEEDGATEADAVADTARRTARAAAEALGAQASPDVAGPGAEAPRRVLLVEDNVVNQMVFRAMIAEHGVAVTVAGDGEEGLAAWRKGSFDLVVSDLSMPVMDGLAMARALRAEEAERAAAPTRLVALTAHVLSEERARCAEAGFDAFLAKPLGRAELTAALEETWGTEDGASDPSLLRTA